VTDHVETGVHAAGNRAPSDGQRMSEPDARDPGSPRNREGTPGVSTPGTSSAHGIDPIGVSDTPEAAGEYDCMIGPLLHRLSRGTASITPRIITRFGVVVTALGGVLAFGAAAPAAFATLPPPEPGRTGDTAPAVIHTVIVGGMPGEKIILIAPAAAALAAVAAVLLDRARATRRHMTAPDA
jgi:hypothetical protein